MKNQALGLLLLAAAGGIFAQETEPLQGLTWSGTVKTGLRFEASNAQGETRGPRFDLYNEDAGERTRIDLDFAYTKDNYGAAIGLRTNDPFRVPTLDLFRQGYVWAEFADRLINLKLGKIDDPSWATTGPEEFRGDFGGGLRLELKPLEGLNLGFFLNGPEDYLNSSFWQHNTIGYAADFFLETALGIKYKSPLFAIIAGLRLDGPGDGLSLDKDHYTAEYLEAARIHAKDPEDWDDKGLLAWAGFDLHAVPNLTVMAEGLFANLGGFGDYGWIWLDEVAEYAFTENLTGGIRMDQFIYGNGDPAKGGHKPWLKFEPALAYAVTEAWTAGLKIPVIYQAQAISYALGLKPTLAYKLGEQASIEGFYLFNLIQPDKGGSGDLILENTLQIDFIWKF